MRKIINNKIQEPHNKEKITSSKDIANIMYKIYKYNKIEKEAFYIIGLYANNNIKLIELHTIGSDNFAYPIVKEICRTLLLNNCTNTIVCHNHPSGDSNPSKEDIKFTKTLKEGLKLLDINLLDHIILGNSFYSLADNNDIY